MLNLFKSFNREKESEISNREQESEIRYLAKLEAGLNEHNEQLKTLREAMRQMGIMLQFVADIKQKVKN